MEGQINHFKARVELMLSARNQTPTDLARSIGMTPQALRDILRRGTPRLDTIRKIAAALECEPGELLKAVTTDEWAALMPHF